MTSLEKLRAEMARRQIEGLLLNDLPSVSWLTGFSGTAGRVLVTASDALFITDSRYTVQAAEEVQGMGIASFSSPVDGDDFLLQKSKELAMGSIAVGRNTMTYGAFQGLSEKLAPMPLVPIDSIVDQFRMVKTPEEIEKLTVACQFADKTFEFMLDRLQIGRSEHEISLDLEFFIRRHGHELAFPPIVVSGENSARPHGHASDRVLADGDFVTMDFGACIDGYNSDITRTVVMGTASSRHQEIYNQVLKAQLAALEAIRPGVKASEVDAIARTVLDEIGLAKYFGHGLGHGLGRMVHDTGRMAGSSKDVFEIGQVWTVEPGVYIANFGGVRIEDDVVVRDDGIEFLTHSSKDLLELPLK